MRADRRYSGRLRSMLRDFGARFADIDAIYRKALAEERQQVQPTWWRRLWTKFWRRHTADSARVMDFMTTLDEQQVVDIASSALGEASAAHRKFNEHHGLEHADAAHAHKGSSADEDVRYSPSAPQGLPLNSTGDARDFPSDADLQMSIDVSSVQFPATRFQTMASPAQARSADGDFLRVNASGLVFVAKATNSQRHLSRPQNAQCPQGDASVELQEVVVHGSESSAGVLQLAAHLQAAVAPRDPADERAAAVSKPAPSRDSRGIRANKIIGALAPDRKGSAGAKLLMTAARRRVETTGADDCAGQGGRDVAEGLAMAEDAAQRNSFPIDQSSDGGAHQARVPPPPPRSRSSSRLRPTIGSDAGAVTGNGEFREQPSMEGGQGMGQRPSTTHFPPRRLPSSLSQHQPPDARSRIRDEASSAHASPSVPKRGEKAADRAPHAHRQLDADTAVTFTHADAQRPRHRPSDGVEQQAADPPRSRSRSRNRTDAAGNRASFSSARVPSPTEPQTKQAPIAPTASSAAISSQARPRAAASSLLLDAAPQEAKAAAPGVRSSKKPSSRRQAQAAAVSWEQKVKAMKEQFGDEFEEC